MAHRGVSGLREYRSVSVEEAGLGAFARRQRRRSAVIAVLGIVLITAAGWLYRTLRSGDPTGSGGPRAVKVECRSCGYVGVVKVAPDQVFPVLCPRCKARACNELWKCFHCQHEFVPKKSPNPIACPNCQSTDVGAAPLDP